MSVAEEFGDDGLACFARAAGHDDAAQFCECGSEHFIDEGLGVE